MNIDRFKQTLARHEGKRPRPYDDANGKTIGPSYRVIQGKLTIGIGHNLEDNPLPDHIIDLLLDSDVATVLSQLDASVPWWRNLDEVRQEALANMCFNMGIASLLGFRNTLRHLKEGRYPDAASGVRNSRYYRQTGRRGEEVARMIETGIYDLPD